MKFSQERLDKVRAKIAKMLKLGKSPEKNEAMRAILMAQKLALKYDLDIETITCNDSTDTLQDVVKDESYDMLSTHPKTWEVTLLAIIAKNFRCECVYQEGVTRNEKTVVRSCFTLVGTKQDVEFAKATIRFTFTAVAKCFIDYWAENKEFAYYKFGWDANAKRRARASSQKDYRMGFLVGLKQKFAHNVKENALILAKPDAVVAKYNEHIEELGGRVKRDKRQLQRGRDPVAYQQGINDGRSTKPNMVGGDK